MSRSTDASTGQPDDDEGRLDATDSTDSDEPQAGRSDAVGDADGDLDDGPVEDAVVDSDDADLDDADGEDAGPDDEDDADRDEDAVAAAAAPRTARTGAAATRSSARDSKAAPTRRPAAVTGRPTPKTDERRGPIAAIVLFVRQVIAELRKVVTPTTRELGTYSVVVIVFVLVVMAYIGVLDLGIGRLVLWAFGG